MLWAITRVRATMYTRERWNGYILDVDIDRDLAMCCSDDNLVSEVLVVK